jgi:sugar-specific transcriptional regulator TrmB
MLKELLRDLGLNDTETSLYMVLFENGPMTASSTAKKTHINRTTAYMALQNLVKKGLVNKSMKSKVTRFAAERPESLVNYIEREQNKLSKLKEKTNSMLPQLESMMNSSGDLPTIQLYEGFESIKNCFMELLHIAENSDEKVLRGYLLPAQPIENADLYKFIHQKYKKERIKKNIKVLNISPATETAYTLVADDKVSLRETRLVPLRDFPFSTSEINIIGPYFHYFSYGHGRMVAAIIKDEDLASTQRAIWDTAWKQAASEHAKLIKAAK